LWLRIRDKVSDRGVLYDNYILYTPIIDSHTLLNDKVDVYFAGWQMSGTVNGLVVVKAKANLTDDPSIQIITDEVLLLTEGLPCYDIWSDVNRPRLFLDTINNERYLILAVTGRCDGIWKIKIKDQFIKSPFLNFTYQNPNDNFDIFSIAYDFKDHIVFYALKKYNSDDISLHFMEMKYDDHISPNPALKILGKNDTNPILSYDSNNNNLLFISAESDHIYQIPGSNIKASPLIASLPPKLRQVSAARVFGDWLYMVTYEPDAQFARIQLSKRFCNNFCGTFGYCVAKPNICGCATGYTLNITSSTNDTNTCVPKHEVDINTTINNERGVAIALGILFFIAFFAAVAGWIMWWRARQSHYQVVRT